MELLKVSNATKRFSGLTAVNDVTFSVKKGQILGIIGPNGSGKTTLISMISGTHSITEGNIFYKDLSIKKLQPYQRARMGIARTFQIVKPLKNLTVLDNIMTAALFGRHQMSTAKEISLCLSGKFSKTAYIHTKEIMEIAGLQDKSNVFARNLTLPDRKRLEVARALAMNPELLLLDEVMAGLNHKEVENVMKLIRDINKNGVTILMIEHIMKVIMGISDRVVVMNHGSLICDGKPQDVANDERVIQAYLGNSFKNQQT